MSVSISTASGNGIGVGDDDSCTFEIIGSTTKAFRLSKTPAVLADLLAASPSRKIVRMAVATLHNLARTHDDDILVELFTTSILRQLEAMVEATAAAAALECTGMQSAPLLPPLES